MIKKFSPFVILFILFITGLSGYFITTLKFNYDFESFLPKETGDLEFYNDYREKFGDDGDFILIAVENKPSVFEKPFLEEIDTLTKQFKLLPHIKRVVSLTNLKIPVISQFGGGTQIKVLHPEDEKQYKKDSTFLMQHPDIVSSFISYDARATCIYLQLDTILTKVQADSLYSQFQELVDNSSLKDPKIASRITAEKHYIGMMEDELKVFISISFVLIVSFLWIAFRAFWGVIIPLVVVAFAVIWSLGAMGAYGQPIDIMTVLLPSIMFVVGMSDMIHMIAKYIEQLRTGQSIPDALRTTIKEIGTATLLTSVTTAIGFTTLLSTNIGPLQSFGVFTAIGTMLAFVISILFLPAILIHLKRPKISNAASEDRFWNKKLSKLLRWIYKHYKAIGIASIILIGVSLYGISRIEINVMLTDEVSEEDEMRQDFMFMEEYFGGARPFEMSLILKDSTTSYFDWDVVQELVVIEKYLHEKYGLETSTSPLTILRTLHRSMNGGLPEYYSIPDNKDELNRINKKLKKFLKYPGLNKLVSKDGIQARFTGRLKDYGSAEMEVKNNKLHETLKMDLVDVRITGTALLLDKNNNYLSVNMIEGLSIAFFVIATIMGLLFRSFKMVLIALIPNIIPLLMIGGIIGFGDVGLKVSTSIIFTIAFGIAVDDTIHFMSKLKIELGKGKSMMYAIKRSFMSTGKAIIITSIILSGGFLTLIFSKFNGTFYTGLLVSITLVIAVFADLLLIPTLLLLFTKRKKKKF